MNNFPTNAWLEEAPAVKGQANCKTCDGDGVIEITYKGDDYLEPCACTEL